MCFPLVDSNFAQRTLKNYDFFRKTSSNLSLSFYGLLNHLILLSLIRKKDYSRLLKGSFIYEQISYKYQW